VNLNIAFQFLAIALIGGERRAVGLEPASVALEPLFYLCNVFGKGCDLTFETHNFAIKRLKTQRQSKVLQHLASDSSMRRMQSPANRGDKEFGYEVRFLQAKETGGAEKHEQTDGQRDQ